MIKPIIVYIGTKTLKAIALTLGEYNTLQGWQISAEQDPSTEGYLVEYLDGGKPNHKDYEGYISWSPKEVFEKAYKPISTPKDRVLVEMTELKARADLLLKFIQGSQPSFISDKAWQLNKEQWDAMMYYYTILEEKYNLM